MISGFEATTTVIISIWVITGFLLLPAGSLRYWTAAFVALLAVVGFGDHLPVRALLVALLAIHVLFVAPAASRSGQRPLLWMALISLALLAALVITGGVHYWLPALLVAVVALPLGVPLLWTTARASGPTVEVRLWPRRRGFPLPNQPHPAGSAPAPPPPEPSGAEPAQDASSQDDPSQDVSTQDVSTQDEPSTDDPSTDDTKPPTPRNVRQFPPGRRPGSRPPTQSRPQRQRRPPTAS
jgi:hypothetical protein